MSTTHNRPPAERPTKSERIRATLTGCPAAIIGGIAATSLLVFGGYRAVEHNADIKARERAAVERTLKPVAQNLASQTITEAAKHPDSFTTKPYGKNQLRIHGQYLGNTTSDGIGSLESDTVDIITGANVAGGADPSKVTSVRLEALTQLGSTTASRTLYLSQTPKEGWTGKYARGTSEDPIHTMQVVDTRSPNASAPAGQIWSASRTAHLLTEVLTKEGGAYGIIHDVGAQEFHP